jgi:DNA-binding Xre family transcriptional regulator
MVFPPVGKRNDHSWESELSTLGVANSHVRDKQKLKLLARHRLRDTIRHILDEAGVDYRELIESGAVTNGALGRIRSDEGQNVMLDQLDRLAEALDLEPWQLLHPDFETAQFSKYALLAAHKIDQHPPEFRAQLYQLLQQLADFGNAEREAGEAAGPSAADAANAPAAQRPRRVRRVHR